MLAPVWLVATGAITLIALASIMVVVVLPLVPVTSATVRSLLSRASASGSSASVTRPPMMPPAPPATLDRLAARLPAFTAAAVRVGSSPPRWLEDTSSPAFLGSIGHPSSTARS